MTKRKLVPGFSYIYERSSKIEDTWTVEFEPAAYTFDIHGPRFKECRLAFKYGVVKCSRLREIFANISLQGKCAIDVTRGFDVLREFSC